MERRELLIGAAAGAALIAGFDRIGWAQGRGMPIDWTAESRQAGQRAGREARQDLES